MKDHHNDSKLLQPVVLNLVCPQLNNLTFNLYIYTNHSVIVANNNNYDSIQDHELGPGWDLQGPQHQDA